jgi:hypothetical protein
MVIAAVIATASSSVGTGEIAARLMLIASPRMSGRHGRAMSVVVDATTWTSNQSGIQEQKPNSS